MTQTETCQQCNGKGFEYEWDADEQRSVKEACTACNGTGEVQDEELSDEVVGDDEERN